MRLNAYLAAAGVASRRKADELIQTGRVRVNGRAGQLNDDVGDQDVIELDGKPVTAQDHRYILLNKPAGYVSTLADTHGRPKVTDLVDINERVVPVGRLDLDTTGALLLTNDGQLTNQLAHPSFKVDKVYEATIEGKITPGLLNKLSNGLEIDGKLTAPAKARQISDNLIELTVHEGRKHQVKKMLAAVGLNVINLHRARFGPLELSGLKPGQWRELTPAELRQLKVIQ